MLLYFIFITNKECNFKFKTERQFGKSFSYMKFTVLYFNLYPCNNIVTVLGLIGVGLGDVNHEL